MPQKPFLKIVLVVVGLALVLVGVNDMLSQPASTCITFLFIPLGCYSPAAFGWLGGLLTAIVGLALVLIGVKA